MRKINVFNKISEVLENKKRMIIAGSLAGVMLLSGGCKNTSEKDAEPTPSPSINLELDDAPIASENVEIIEENEVTEEAIILSAENFSEEVAKIVESDVAKGLFISEDKVKSALLITNIDSLSTEDIYTLFGHKLDGINNENTRLKVISEEIQNMYDYVSAVRTHNNHGNEYVSMSQLAYNVVDKIIVNELDAQYIELAKKLNDETITEEEYQNSFKSVTEFYTGIGYIAADEGVYSNYSLTAGAGLLSEAYWPMFAVAYSSNELLTAENEIDIQTLSNVVNGSKYLASIINIAEICTNTLEDEKTLSK